MSFFLDSGKDATKEWAQPLPRNIFIDVASYSTVSLLTAFLGKLNQLIEVSYLQTKVSFLCHKTLNGDLDFLNVVSGCNFYFGPS